MLFYFRNKSLFRNIFATLTFFLFFIFFLCLSLWRYNIGQVFYYDFGHFARILWLISQFSNPLINHKVLGEIHFLGDHFSPSLYLLSPLFWITNKSYILLIEQDIATIFSGILVFQIARKEKLPFIFSYLISCVFLIFAGLENPLVTDWHTESTAVIFLLLFIYFFFYSKKQCIAIFFACIFIGFKDSNAISLIFILIPYFFLFKSDRKKIFYLAIFSLIWFIIVGYVITPMISQQAYLYSPVLPANPVSYVTNYFNTPIKQRLVIDSFGSFAFMPLFSGAFIIPIIAELGIRLIPTYMHSQCFTLGMHYNVFLAAFLALATIHAFKYLQLILKTNKIMYLIISFFLLFSLLYAKKITHPPILMALNPVFWKQWNKKSELFNQLKIIPKTGTIMSQNNFLPHLISRKDKIYLLSLSYKQLRPTYIIFDLSTGQNINNYYSGEINNIDQVDKLKELLVKDENYKRILTPYQNLYFFKNSSFQKIEVLNEKK